MTDRPLGRLALVGIAILGVLVAAPAISALASDAVSTDVSHMNESTPEAPAQDAAFDDRVERMTAHLDAHVAGNGGLAHPQLHANATGMVGDHAAMNITAQLEEAEMNATAVLEAHPAIDESEWAVASGNVSDRTLLHVRWMDRLAGHHPGHAPDAFHGDTPHDHDVGSHHDSTDQHEPHGYTDEASSDHDDRRGHGGMGGGHGC